ncbi:penicillin acylase family protein [Agromyces larvae]|uniref:Penicillin acylase family protein n=1 Tax=Agromyces larvae TaxID=2929802 RepID=A0ABY4C2D5_9MICO|nr:penicillin acylase family protein [Agromyces larvae]UOE45627.1 penicillin acylase family protein [Agromyces larvae]
MGTDAPRTHRRRLVPFLVGLLVAVLVLVVVAAGAGWWTVSRSFPTTSGRIDAAGLIAPVTVVRDDAGIPHLTADTDHDLFFAQGYVHAQDRFWEMDFRRHVTAGRLAELFGESQVGTDAFIRTLNWRGVAEVEYEQLDEPTRAIYDAYAEGVNAYLAEHSGADLSLEYAVLALQNPGYAPEPWSPVDSIAWLKAMAWDLRSNLEDEIDRALLATALPAEEVQRLHPGYSWGEMPTIVGGAPAAAPATVGEVEPVATGGTEGADVSDASGSADDADAAGAADALAALQATLHGLPELLGPAGHGIGSNSWVVSGALTDTGQPLLANDPHLGPAMPSIWTQMGLSCSTVGDACGYRVSGYTFSGLPGVIIGHNEQVAWGFTNLGPDVADLYVERIADDTYELDGAQVPLELREETIDVAGGDSVTITVRSTGRGPIVTDLTESFTRTADGYPEASGLPDGDYGLSLQWTALTPGTTASAIFALNRAQNWGQFQAAAALFDVPSQNLVYADVEGNIGYQAPGNVPIRAAGDGTLPLPGWTSENGWVGQVPFAQLPSVFNPERGYIVTANNAVSADGPFLTADWDLGYRARSIEQRLRAHIDAGEPITADMMADIQLETGDANAATFLELLPTLELDGDAASGAKLLASWDAHADADSAGAAYFAIFWKTLLERMFHDLPDGTRPVGGDRWFTVVDTLLQEPDSPWWTDPETGVTGRDAVIAASLAAAWQEAGDRLGSDPSRWRWGRLHTLTLRNQSFGESGIGPIEWLFNRGPYELGGGSAIPNAIAWDASVGYEVNWVPSMRMIVDVSDWDASRWINLTGSSGHAFSTHYDDQTKLWQAGRTRPWAFTADAVTAARADTLVLLPAG